MKISGESPGHLKVDMAGALHPKPTPTAAFGVKDQKHYP
jgi:hypothetical protein